MAELRESIKRNVAYKIRIGDLLNGKPVAENERFGFLEVDGKKLMRVNVVANVIEKYQSEGGMKDGLEKKKYMALTIDDASGQIRVKAFGEDVDKYAGINQGDTILLVGSMRSYNNELYINPEIIKIVDPRYLLVRKLELEKSKIGKKETVQDKTEIKAIKDRVLEMIKNAEIDGGLDADKIIMEIKAIPDLINQEIKKLLEEGLIYEPRPGRLRYLG